MLAGIGSGNKYFKISPTQLTATMIKNCRKYFMKIYFPFFFSLNNHITEVENCKQKNGANIMKMVSYHIISAIIKQRDFYVGGI